MAGTDVRKESSPSAASCCNRRSGSSARSSACTAACSVAVATGSKCDWPENGSTRPIGNRWQPTATVSERMVEGVDPSTGRVDLCCQARRRSGSTPGQQDPPQRPISPEPISLNDAALRAHASAREPVASTFNPKVAGSIPARPIRSECVRACLRKTRRDGGPLRPRNGPDGLGLGAGSGDLRSSSPAVVED